MKITGLTQPKAPEVPEGSPSAVYCKAIGKYVSVCAEVCEYIIYDEDGWRLAKKYTDCNFERPNYFEIDHIHAEINHTGKLRRRKCSNCGWSHLFNEGDSGVCKEDGHSTCCTDVCEKWVDCKEYNWRKVVDK